ncbi:MAG TPA: hypothetical protein VF384_05515 [Planctomycetota bacterium]
MNSFSIVLLSVSLSAAGATIVSLALRTPSDVSPIDAASVAELQRAVGELRAENTALQARLTALATAPASSTVPSSDRVAAPSITNEQIAAAVEAYLKRSGGAAAVGGSDASVAAFDLEADFKKLIGASYWDGDNAALWKKAFAAGAMDEVIKRFEDLAKANPNDIPTQMNLAQAYMAYLQLDQTKWQMSMKADGVFDKVLELDENHWEARFTKAVSYTFWPDFLGKKPSAISHFETLVAQQEKLPVEDHQAETYLYLGNLLEQRDPARAKEMWLKGARRHPNHKELAKKAGL